MRDLKMNGSNSSNKCYILIFMLQNWLNSSKSHNFMRQDLDGTFKKTKTIKH